MHRDVSDTENRRISVDAIPGIIDFKTIKTILFFARGPKYYLEGGPEFLDSHVSEWRERTLHNRCGMRDIKGTESEYISFLDEPHEVGVFFHYMRSFFCLTGDETNVEVADGFQCKRRLLKISHSDRALQLRERRYSIALNVFPFPRPCGVFTLLSLMDEVKSERNSRWRYSLTAHEYIEDRAIPWGRYGILPAGLYTGISVFQLQICAFIEAWELDWDETINKLADIVSVKVCGMILILKPYMIKAYNSGSLTIWNRKTRYETIYWKQNQKHLCYTSKFSNYWGSS